MSGRNMETSNTTDELPESDKREVHDFNCNMLKSYISGESDPHIRELAQTFIEWYQGIEYESINNMPLEVYVAMRGLTHVEIDGAHSYKVLINILMDNDIFNDDQVIGHNLGKIKSRYDTIDDNKLDKIINYLMCDESVFSFDFIVFLTGIQDKISDQDMADVSYIIRYLLHTIHPNDESWDAFEMKMADIE